MFNPQAPSEGEFPRTQTVEEARTQPLPVAGTPGRAKSHTMVVLSPTFPQLPSAGTATRESVEAASAG